MRRLHLLYHELRPTPSSYSYVIDVADFRKQMDLISRMSERSDVALSPHVTFDDGHISNFEYALPILQEQNIEAHFFITVGWTGNKQAYMGWRELKHLHASGQRIGAHGWSHTLLTHCSPHELNIELSHSRMKLEDKLGCAVTTMSLPGGRYNRRVLAACLEAGYTQIYTSIPRSESDPLAQTIGRLNIRREMKLEWIENLFDPSKTGLPRLERVYRAKAAAQALMGDRMYKKLWALLNREEPDAQRVEGTPE